jgi:hypothetical protein
LPAGSIVLQCDQPGGEADFSTKLKSSDCEPKESNFGRRSRLFNEVEKFRFYYKRDADEQSAHPQQCNQMYI